jgi:hypothetical protein
MTANELADINEWSCCAHSKDVSTVLRQQAQEIDELRERLEETRQLYIKELALQRLSDISQEFESFDRTASHMANEYVSYRELTDEEIESTYWSLVGKQHQGKIASYLYNFARDILQKASEK